MSIGKFTGVIWLFLTTTLYSAWAQAANTVDSIRVWPSPSNTRVVIDLKKKPDFTYFSLSNPQRLVIDLTDTKNTYQIAKLKHKSKLLRKVRVSKAKKKGGSSF